MERVQNTCGVCDTRGEAEVFSVREMMFGVGESFRYLRCASCGSLQLLDPPQDMARYYPDSYYSYNDVRQSAPRVYLKRVRLMGALGMSPPGGGVVTALWGQPSEALALRLVGATRTTSILDVGCGNGAFLRELAAVGFRNLTGVDPYLTIDPDSSVRWIRSALDDVEGPYDVITMHHSLEHTSQPRAVVRKAAEILRSGGYLIVRIPVTDTCAWRTYGVDWVQIDAPRHLYVLSEAGMKRLAEAAGLELVHQFYDSTEFQFWGSEQYRMDIPLEGGRSYRADKARSPFSPAQIREFRARARKLNEAADGDQACFIFRRPGA